jgi:D-threo-aldose 1-dehydrogenase
MTGFSAAVKSAGKATNMNDETIELGATGLRVTRLCAGSGTWRPFDGGPDVPERDSIALVHSLFESATVRYLDTSNNYGWGEAERRLGVAIREYGGVPADFVIQTKADRDMTTGRFDGARMRRSLEESMGRLGLDHLPIVFLHDPENTTWEASMAEDGPVAALVAAREDGLIGHLGISGGPVDMLTAYVETGLFEALITHNRYTLVDRSADALLTLAASRGLGVLNASPYGGGMLTKWPVAPGRYAYGDAPSALVAAANAIGAICNDFGVPFVTAALHFSLRDPRITSTIIGMRTVADADASAELAAQTVPAALWAAIDEVRLDPSTWQG